MVLLGKSVLDGKASGPFLRSQTRKSVQEEAEREFNASKNIVQESILPEKYLASKEYKLFKWAFGEDLSALHIKRNNRKSASLPTEVKVRLILECALKDWSGKSDVSCIFFDVSKDVKEFFKKTSTKIWKFWRMDGFSILMKKNFSKKI